LQADELQLWKDAFEFIPRKLAQDFVVDLLCPAIRTRQVMRSFRRSLGIHVLVPGQWMISGVGRSSEISRSQTAQNGRSTFQFIAVPLSRK
jgi:hypothetical protein